MTRVTNDPRDGSDLREEFLRGCASDSQVASVVGRAGRVDVQLLTAGANEQVPGRAVGLVADAVHYAGGRVADLEIGLGRGAQEDREVAVGELPLAVRVGAAAVSPSGSTWVTERLVSAVMSALVSSAQTSGRPASPALGATLAAAGAAAVVDASEVPVAPYAAWKERLARPMKKPSTVVVTGASGSAAAPSATNRGVKCSTVGCA